MVEAKVALLHEEAIKYKILNMAQINCHDKFGGKNFIAKVMYARLELACANCRFWNLES